MIFLVFRTLQEVMLTLVLVVTSVWAILQKLCISRSNIIYWCQGFKLREFNNLDLSHYITMAYNVLHSLVEIVQIR